MITFLDVFGFIAHYYPKYPAILAVVFLSIIAIYVCGGLYHGFKAVTQKG